MSIRIGDKVIATNFDKSLLKEATTEEAGIIRIAKDNEITAGISKNSAVTPYQLANAASKTQVDDTTIVKDQNDIITAIGIKSKNDSIIYNWIGTSAEYEKDNELGKIQPNWVCYITDDNDALTFLTPKYGSDIALLDIITTNHILTGVEKVGKEAQGALILKSEYPEAYKKLLDSLNNPGSQKVTKNIAGVEVTYTRCYNGYHILDIKEKPKYDEIFNKTGSANFFVIDKISENFYLPKTKNINQPCIDTRLINDYNEAGLPNITGAFGTTYNDPSQTGNSPYEGAFAIRPSTNTKRVAGTDTGANVANYTFDSSRSNTTYGKSNTVQPQTNNVFIYYKVGNTVINDATIDLAGEVANLKSQNNIAFTMFQSRYSPIPITNMSWLESKGQWNDGTVYEGAYKELEYHLNNPEGFEIKKHNEEYTDYDFVINTENKTFRLPLLNGAEDIPGTANNVENHENPTTNGQEYTINYNGNFNIHAQTDAANQYIRIQNMTTGDDHETRPPLTQVGAMLTCQVKKGNKVKIYGDKVTTIDKVQTLKYVGNGKLYYYIGNTLVGMDKVNFSKLQNTIITMQSKITNLESIIQDLLNGIDGGKAKEE